MKIEVVNTMGNADAWWFIHAAGCQDVAREVRKYRHLGGDVERHDVESVEAYVKDECETLNADHGEGSFRPEHFRIMPCVRR